MQEQQKENKHGYVKLFENQSRMTRQEYKYYKIIVCKNNNSIPAISLVTLLH